MTWIDEEAYETAIKALNNFKKQVTDQCNLIEKAARDCVENTKDPNAQSNSTKLTGHISKIKAQYETINKIISALQAQLEEVRKVRREAEAAGNE
ncbi:MAG: hypothetical protein IJM96_08425 [Clostridia bacterium]|nr:hypothetical protein [Clostridia bacterium]